MDIEDVFYLATWYLEQGPKAGQLYEGLQTVLQHNASQNEKQPVREPLDALISGLRALPMHELNLQQVSHLDDMGVGRFLGERGAAFVKQVVTQSSYDPATSALEIKTAADKVNSTIKTFQTLTNTLALAGFQFEDSAVDLSGDEAMVRIQFRQDASIGSIAEMKKWSGEWNDIVRGIAHLVGESPHDMKVVGASKGSIIICVTGSLMLISCLAFMSRKVSGIVLDGLRVQHAIEDLRHKKISNEFIEKSMKEDLKKREDALVRDVITELKAKAGDRFAPEHNAHLEMAVGKYANFRKKGGELDYLQPPEPSADDEGEADGPTRAHEQLVEELRTLISEIRSIKGETLLLEDLTDNAAE